ncbi:MAG: ABC transporter permease [Candidatus Bathyarchaeota archaeon]|nr:ABC transporter permease [Chloroflexota bacterium]MCL5877524.1 ABC transporter permease [Candidatus Bathyarchaeota archaeon]
MVTNFFSDTYAVLWVDLRNMRRHWKSTIATSLVLPLLYLVAFGYGLGQGVNVDGVSYLAFVIPGIVALTAFSISFNGAASKLQVDKFFYKSFDELLMSPVSSYSIVIGKALIGVLRGSISALAIYVVGFALAAPTLLANPPFFLMLLLSCFVFALFGVLIALVINSHQSMSTFSTVVMLPMTFLCGTFFSLSQLPDVAKAVLYFLPLTHVSNLLRTTVLGQPFPWLSFVGLIVFGFAFFVGCMVALKRSSV